MRVGASANVVIAQIAKRNNHGFPLMILSLAFRTVYVYVRYFVLQ